MCRRIIGWTSVLLVLLAACAPLPPPGASATVAPIALPTPGATAGPAAPPTPGASPAPSSGIEGQILIGPACPVVQIGSPCPDQPFQATVNVLSTAGAQVLQFQSDARGRFRVALPPGSYVLRPESPGGPTRAPEQTVTVQPGAFAQVTITYDSGIR
ncbi:MAG: carboxypeptidase regulatory-like domain-containing protein [Chloroflexi bacterium]|nr:carboxypeptidase regulatory-like domain-containing protein [Chloroflexota bacterium]